MEQGDLDRAIADFDQAIKLEGDDESAYVNRGRAHARKGNFDQAISDLMRAIELTPGLTLSHQSAVDVSQRKDDKARTFAYLLKIYNKEQISINK